jgi:hypothetical protein
VDTTKSFHAHTTTPEGGTRSDRGATFVEIIVSLAIVLVVSGGMVSLYGVSLRSNTINSLNTQLLSSARAKLEQMHAIPYEQVGIAAAGASTGPAYIVSDPYFSPVYDLAKGDDLLSDTVTLQDGTRVTRTVTVTAVDDPADGTGNDDADGATDPNTGTILDYKIITVRASASLNNLVSSQTLATIIRGSLPAETDGATGEDSGGANPVQVKKVKNTKGVVVPPPVPPEDATGCVVVAAPKGKKLSKKGASTPIGC